MFGKGQVVGGVAMLVGSVAGGYIAQVTNLGVPFILRAVVLAIMFGFAFVVMRDVGFTPRRGQRLTVEMGRIAGASIQYGWRVPAVKWLMLASPFTAGVGVYSFYALQPYLLELYGDPKAYGIAGLVAAIVAGAQIVGGFAAPWIRRLFDRRTSALLAAAAASSLTLALIGAFENFWSVLGADRGVGAALRGVDADPPDVPQRADPVGAAGDHPVLRLHARLERRRGHPAGAGARRGRRGLRELVPDRGPPSRPWPCPSSSCRAGRTRRPTPSRGSPSPSPSSTRRPPSSPRPRSRP